MLEKYPEDYELVSDEIMSNFDHEINKDLAEKIKEENIVAEYPAWNFFGRVWYDKKDRTYKCQVMRYNSHVETVSGSLEDIMTELDMTYGDE